MNNRRDPIETGQKTTIIYPSGLFSLEKDEVFPYERFAYNVLEVGIYALKLADLPECLTLDFTHFSENGSPWLINCSVLPQYSPDGEIISFKVAIPELVPALIYMFCFAVVSKLFHDDNYKTFKTDPHKARKLIQYFVDGGSASVRAYKKNGIGRAIRAGYEHFGLIFNDLFKTGDDFDMLTKQIAYHEIAHIYVSDLIKQTKALGAQRFAFELIADLVGTEWFYNAMIRLTPDTDEYRNLRGMDTFEETIFANSLMAMKSQQAILILSAIAGAQRSGGKVSLSGGQTHPPGFQRHQLQHIHLHTLIASNFSDVLSEHQLKQIKSNYSDIMDILVASGIIPMADVMPTLDPLECDSIEAAADLIEELKVSELIRVVPFLRSIRELLSETLKKRP
jgi:hypothetical protein